MKKIISSIIAIIAMIMLAGVCLAASTGTVTGDNLRLRSKASTNSTAIDVLNKGTKVNILSTEGDFYKVSVGDQTGYLSKEYVQTNSSTTSNSTNSSNTNKTSTNSNTSSSNKTSESSSTSSANKTSESSNTSSANKTSESSSSSSNKTSENVNSSANSNSTNSTTNSVNNSNTANDDSDTETNTDSNTTSTTEAWSEETINKANTTILTSKATLYVLPLLNSTKLGELASGTEVLLISVNGKWAYIQTSSQSGWINKSLLQNQIVTVPQNY